jgi:protocatechuate 3,4-dioxygenase beta subunit
MKTAVVAAVLFGATSLVAQVPSTGRAVIAGRVIDDLGDPVIAARVTVERRTAAGGVAAVATADTDDRGEHRVPGLPAGSFLVAVLTIGGIRTQTIGTQVAWAPDGHKTVAPGVGSAAEASTVTLQSSEERADINFVVPAAQATTQPFSLASGGGATMIVTSPFTTSVPRLGTGVIRGRVVATDGRPLARAQVGLVLAAAPRPTQDLTRADSGGAFEFRGLSPGTYRIVASKSGYEPIVADAPPLRMRILYSGRSVTLAAGAVIDPIDVPLAPLATLSGVVLDENGDPLQGASVQLLTIRYEAGRRQLVSAEVAARVTDDLGRYRLFGLAPGQYVVSASIGSVSSADVPGFVRSYFPATSSPSSAQFVVVRRSEGVAGIDIAMVRGRTARVTGRILDAAGQPTTGGTVMLRPRQRASIVGVSVGARLLPDGRFEFPNVPPGDYVIQANRGRTNPSVEGEFAALPITVNGSDLTDLVLAMSIGSTVSGVIRFDTLSPDRRPASSTVEISSFPVDFDLAPGTALPPPMCAAEGQFR